MKSGFTSYSNDHTKCPCLSDELFRLKVVLEAHMGISGDCKVMIKTIAREIGKDPKTIGRELKKLRETSNLKMVKQGKLYHFSTIGDVRVLYGKTLVSPIMPHQCPMIKRIDKKENNKNLEIHKNQLTNNEEQLIEKIIKWQFHPDFKTFSSPRTVRAMLTHLLKKHGFEVINRAFENTANKRYNPHPKDFWNAVNELKTYE